MMPCLAPVEPGISLDGGQPTPCPGAFHPATPNRRRLGVSQSSSMCILCMMRCTKGVITRDAAPMNSSPEKSA